MKNQEMPLILLGTSLTGCGVGGFGTVGTTNPPPLSNPTPTIVTISPNRADTGSAAFTLSVVGSNFIPTSTVQWNGTSRLTTYLSASLVTAEIAWSDLAGAGPDIITVVNPALAGGLSNAKDFVIPCVIPTPTTAANQSRAKVGAFYFDGWSTPLNNFHFDGLLNGNFKSREPLSGWQDAGPCAIERQLAWGHKFGLDFFVFDWHFNASVNEPGDNLNSTLQITRSLPDWHGMQYAIQYVSAPPFLVGPSDWASAAMAGWDPRPPNQPEPVTAKLVWYSRSAQEVAALLQDSIAWVQANPLLRPEPAPAPPLVLIEAWN